MKRAHRKLRKRLLAGAKDMRDVAATNAKRDRVKLVRKFPVYILASKFGDYRLVYDHVPPVMEKTDRVWTGIVLVKQRVKNAAQQLRIRREDPPATPKDAARERRKRLSPTDTGPDPQYAKPAPGGYQLTVKEFLQHVKFKRFVDYDGYGKPVVNRKELKQKIKPSEAASLPDDTTHVNWYARNGLEIFT